LTPSAKASVQIDLNAAVAVEDDTVAAIAGDVVETLTEGSHGASVIRDHHRMWPASTWKEKITDM
jgi:hypothetical protein